MAMYRSLWHLPAWFHTCIESKIRSTSCLLIWEKPQYLYLAGSPYRTTHMSTRSDAGKKLLSKLNLQN